MTNDQITSLAKQSGFLIDEAPISQPYVIQPPHYKVDDELRRFAELVRKDDREMIECLLSALEYHEEQTRPIHSTTTAIQVAREHLKGMT